MVDHDRLFKELLTTFFLDFLALFTPELSREVDPASVEFLEKELYTDVVAGERHEVDLLVKLRRRGHDSCVLVHVESQATAAAEFGRRMFRYFARIEAHHGLPVYPVALFSYQLPRRPEPNAFRIRLPGLDVLRFRFQVVQLNRLSWRAFLRHPNPIAAALMSRMRIAVGERPRVKLECLRMLATLRLDPARTRLVSGVLGHVLALDGARAETFRERVRERARTGEGERHGDHDELEGRGPRGGTAGGDRSNACPCSRSPLWTPASGAGRWRWRVAFGRSRPVGGGAAGLQDAGRSRALAGKRAGVSRQVMDIETGGMADVILRGLEKGRREGRREGRHEGSARTLVRLLTRRYGPLPRDLRLWIGVLTVDDLDRLTDALFGFSSLTSLWVWLANERR